MSLAATALKDMLSISIKPRHDAQTDQYNRIFMVKLFLICSVVMGLSWYTDSINCIVPDSHGVGGGFVSATCWIQGVYIYKALTGRVDDVAYFGMPSDIDSDGYLINSPTQELCRTIPKRTLSNREPKKNPLCKPLEKTFYLQYQYMPFLVAALALLYFLPYIVFKTVNSDLISLKDAVKGDDPDGEKIAEHFFNNRSNPQRNNRFRVLLNIMVKLLYIIANVINFYTLDNLLNGDYRSYGTSWAAWSRLSNTMAHDYMGLRDHPKPGNVLLPPFGYCEVNSQAKDIKESVANSHKYVCELSQNILYQYVLMVMWFALVIGIVVSVLGLIILLVHYFVGVFGLRAHGPTGKRLFKLLSFRELQYLEYIRKKNIELYGEVLDKLRDIKLGPLPTNNRDFPTRDTAPLYPEEDRYDTKKPEYNF